MLDKFYKLIFILALIGLGFLAVSARRFYRSWFPPSPDIVVYETTGEASADAAPWFRMPAQIEKAITLAEPYAKEFTPAVPILCAPGLRLLEALGFTVNSIPEWIIVILISFRVWGLSARLGWIIPARIFGFGYSPRAFRYWLCLTTLPWRPLYGLTRPLLRWLRYRKYGEEDTSRWTTASELFYHVFRPGKLLLGRLSLFNLGFLQPVGIRAQRHVAMIAAPGSGKTVHMNTIIHCHKGAVVVTDCDGESTRATARRKAKSGMKIINLAPYGLVSEFEASGFNVFIEIDDAVKLYGEDAAVEWAATIAEALVHGPKDAGQNEWVYKEGRTVMQGLILYVWKFAAPEDRNLVFAKQLLARGQFQKARPQDDPFQALVLDMKRRPDFDGVIAASGTLLERSMGGKAEGKSPVLATLIEQLSWLDIPAMAKNVRRNDLRCHEVQKGEACVYIVAPTVDLQGKLSGWNRLITNMLLYTFQRAKTRPQHRVLFCLDEFPHQGPNPMILSMAGVGRKYYIQLLIVAQTITQLQAVYPQSWQDFLGTADAVIWMATGDQPTLEYLSTVLGSRTKAVKVSGGMLTPSELREHMRREDRKLMSPSQLREFLKNNIIVTRADDRPMKLKAEPYFRAVPVSWYDADPQHGETVPRALTRRLLRLLKGWRTAQPLNHDQKTEGHYSVIARRFFSLLPRFRISEHREIKEIVAKVRKFAKFIQQRVRPARAERQ